MASTTLLPYPTLNAPILYGTLISLSSGIMVATIIEIGRHIGPFFLMLQLVMIAFAHAMVIVLGRPFQIDSPGDQEFLINRNDTSNFNNIFSSLKYTYYLLTSDGDAYNRWDGVPSTDALRIIFLIFTAIIIFNVLIALMSNIVSKVDSEGRQRWLKVCKVDIKRRWLSLYCTDTVNRTGHIVLQKLSCTGCWTDRTTSIFPNLSITLQRSPRRSNGKCGHGKKQS